MTLLAVLAAQRAPAAAGAALPQQLGAVLQRAFAAKAGQGGGGGAVATIPKKDWSAVKLPEATVESIPVTTLPGQAFVGDLRSTSGLGMGDGKTTHTSKWLTVSEQGARARGARDA